MNDNDNFKINLKKEEFQIIYKNINEIFNGNYSSFVSEIKISKPFLLDLIILLRKYQYFILYILLNKKELAIFNKKENEGKINNILNMKQMMKINEKNEFIFNLNILPKFKKSEINFLIPNDLINLKIKMIIFLNGNNSLIFEECEVEALNLIKSFNEEKYKKLNKILSKILDVFCLENKLNPFNSINKYLNYIENYLPKIFEKKEENVNNNNNNINKDEWNQSEQNKLEELLIKFKDIKDLREKINKIANEIKTKNIKQITMRYKELVLKNINKEENKDEHKNENDIQKENEIKENDIQKENEIKENEIQKEENNNNIKSENDKIVEDQNKINTIKLSSNNNNNNLDSLTRKISDISISSNDSFFKKVLDSYDEIINEIIRVYNKNYSNVDLSLIQQQSNVETSLLVSRSNTFTSENELSSNEEEEEDEKEENNEKKIEDENNDEYKKLKEKNNELIDIYLSSTLQPNISNDDLLLLQNLLNFGEKYQINTLGMKLFNIGLCVISSIKLLLKCIKCNKVAFESFYQKISKNENLFYLGTKCPRCDNEIFSLFKSEFIHENNLDNAGIVYISGGGIIEFLPSTFSLTCLNCNEEKKVKLRTGGLHINDKNCRKCQKELLFFITNISFSITYISNMEFLEKTKIINFNKFNYAIKDDINLDNYIKKFDKIIQEGKPLPDFGICKHYKKSFKWFRFSCCNKTFPCDLCHDEDSDHNCEHAHTILCGFCAFEQQSSNKMCCKCGKMFNKIDGSLRFWNGGKGQRQQEKLSTRDSHKFTGMNKTISRKKQKMENEKKNNNK